MKHCPSSDCPYLEETGRAGEYRDDILRCSDCGSELAVGESPEMKRPGQISWIAVAEVPDPHAAHLVKSALAMEGIASELRPLGKGGGSLVPGQPVKAEVIVPDHMAEAAREVLASRSGAPVALPEGEDLEFVDADGTPLEYSEEDPLEEDPEPDETDVAGGSQAAGGVDAGAAATGFSCPRCSSSGVTSIPPEDPSAGRGFFKRVFASRASWTCLKCGHRW